MKNDPKKFTYQYVCPSDLRDLHVNGVKGSVTPKNDIHMHLISERRPLPKTEVLTFDENGMRDQTVPAEIEDSANVIRLVQASIVIDLQTAIIFRNWLDDRIKHIEAKATGIKGDEHYH